RRRLLPSFALGLALVLGACGDDGDVDAGATASTQPGALDPETPVTSPPDDGAGDVNPDAPARRAVEVTPGLVNPVPTFIESYAAIDETIIELRFTTGVAECYGLDRVQIEETAEAVTVTLFTGGRPGADVCIEIAESVATKVTLPAPLGARTLVDGSTGEPVAVA
ncbi:MAG: hypothetical protein M3527_10560, partial [Actinomycetota bacterium]|nr:hypothetical protein [Actinomycetota bacterium]